MLDNHQKNIREDEAKRHAALAEIQAAEVIKKQTPPESAAQKKRKVI